MLLNSPEHNAVEEDERQQLDEAVDEQRGAVAQEADEPGALPRRLLLLQALGVRHPPHAAAHAQQFQDDLDHPDDLPL